MNQPGVVVGCVAVHLVVVTLGRTEFANVGRIQVIIEHVGGWKVAVGLGHLFVRVVGLAGGWGVRRWGWLHQRVGKWRMNRWGVVAVLTAVLTVVLVTVLAVLATVRRRGVIATTDATTDAVPVLVKRMKSVAAVLQMRMRCNVRQCAAQRVQKVAGQALLGDRRAAVRVAQRVRRVGQVGDQVRWTLVVRSVRSAL